MKPEHVILAAVAPHIPPFRGRGRRKPKPDPAVQAAADAKRKRKAEKRARDNLFTMAGRLK